MKVEISSGWLSVSFCLFVILAILNLCDLAAIPWFWVFAVLWMPIAGIVAIFLLVAIIVAIVKAFDR